MNSLLIGAAGTNYWIVDVCFAVIIALFFLWGFLKGYFKPLTAIVSWGLIILLVYFVGDKLGSLIMEKANLQETIKSFFQAINDSGIAINVDTAVKNFGIGIAAVILFLAIKIITMIINIIVTRATKAHRKGIASRIIGGFLEVIIGVLWIWVMLTLLRAFFGVINYQEGLNYFDNSTIVKYFADPRYNPIILLINAIK